MKRSLLFLGIIFTLFSIANAEEKMIPFAPQYEFSATNNYSGEEPLLFVVDNKQDLDEAVSRFYLPAPIADGNGGTSNEKVRELLKKVIQDDINTVGFDTSTAFSINILSGTDVAGDASLEVKEIRYSEEKKEITVDAHLISGENKSLDKPSNSKAIFCIISRKDAPDFNDSWKFNLNLAKVQKKQATRLPLGDFKEWELEVTFPDTLEEELALGAVQNMAEDGLIKDFKSVYGKKRTYIVFLKETARIESVYEKFRKAKEIKSVKFVNK